MSEAIPNQTTDNVYNIWDCELMTEQEVLEGMHPFQLREFINATNDKIEELHRIKRVAIDVLDGYGEND